MRITKALAALVLVFSLTGYCVSGYISENSRQGSDPVFADSAPGPTPSVSAFTAGFVAWDTTNRIGHRIWGNFRWPDKPGHGVKPCKDEELGDLLDRLDFGRSFGGPGHDPYHYGRHFAKVLTPFLYTGRRWDGFSGQYWHRNRYMNPKYGRFTSSDPIGFNGGNNLYCYAGNNPLIYTDPTGKIFGLLIPIGIKIGQEFADTLNEMGFSISQSADADVVEAETQVKAMINAIQNGPNKDSPKACSTLEKLRKLQRDLDNQRSSNPPKFKKKKPGMSDAEQKNDIPSWAEGERPRVGENGKDFARRLCDEKYGPGNYKTGPGSDFSKLKKYGDSAFE